MILTLTINGLHAEDLGFLLHKHPGRVHDIENSFGTCSVFYPEYGPTRSTAALFLQVDPVGLVRGRRNVFDTLDHYVNDRPYAANSFLSVAMTHAFNTAMTGRSKERQAVADQDLDLEAHLPVLACRGGEAVLRKLFEPLGYVVEATLIPLDDAFPEWGISSYYSVTIKGRKKFNELLRHLYVLIPVLDGAKHYWISDDEIEKLMRHAEDWLSDHPEKTLIVRRYFSRRASLGRQALQRLVGEEVEEETIVKSTVTEEALEAKLSLNQQRMEAVKAELLASGGKRVVDLGCGEGKLLSLLYKERQFEELVGMDVSLRSLEHAEESLHLEDLPQRQRDRLRLMHGSLMYRDKRLEGFDAAACVEVVEHLDAERLKAFERALFEFAQPKVIVLTTPNREFNARFENLPAGTLRHTDHRFEWTRQEFKDWAGKVAAKFNYSWRWAAVGELDPQLGPPTQMGVFTRDHE